MLASGRCTLALLRVAKREISTIFRSRLPQILGFQASGQISRISPCLHCPHKIQQRLFASSQSASETVSKSSPASCVIVSQDGRSCYVEWEDGFQSEFHGAWLAHSCHCKLCRHENGQRLMDPSAFSMSNTISAAVLRDNYLEIEWKDGKHHNVVVPLTYLREHNYGQEALQEKRQLAARRRTVSEIPKVAYEDLINRKDGLSICLQHIDEAGMCVLQGVPFEEEMVVKVAEMIGPIMNTLYGKLFDVVTTTDAINVAYTNLHLDPHMDLVYYDSPPGLQLLHCLKFDDCIEGGESTFIDGFAIAEEFRKLHPDLFEDLTKIWPTFQKVHYQREKPVHMVRQRPHFEVDLHNEIVGVHWAPPFEGPLAVPGEEVHRYFTAYEKLATLIQDPNSRFLVKHRLRPGDLHIFNNQRMFHGRTKIQANGGERLLRGCYVDITAFNSQTLVAKNLLKMES